MLFFLFSRGRIGTFGGPEVGTSRRRRYTLTVERDGKLTWKQGAHGEKRLVRGAVRITVETDAPPARVAKAVQKVKAKARGKPDEIQAVIIALIIAEAI